MEFRDFLIPLGSVAAALITGTATVIGVILTFLITRWFTRKRHENRNSEFRELFNGKTLYAIHYTVHGGSRIVSHHKYIFDKLEGDVVSGVREEHGEDEGYTSAVFKKYTVSGFLYEGKVALHELNSRKNELAVCLITSAMDNHLSGLYASSSNLDATGQFASPILFFEEKPGPRQREALEHEPMWNFYGAEHGLGF